MFPVSVQLSSGICFVLFNRSDNLYASQVLADGSNSSETWTVGNESLNYDRTNAYIANAFEGDQLIIIWRNRSNIYGKILYNCTIENCVVCNKVDPTICDKCNAATNYFLNITNGNKSCFECNVTDGHYLNYSEPDQWCQNCSDSLCAMCPENKCSLCSKPYYIFLNNNTCNESCDTTISYY